MRNSEIADIFYDIAGILEIKGDNPFKIRAYERAAENIEGLTEDIRDYIKTEKLRQIPGIGVDLEAKIKEFVTTGKIKSYEELKHSIPEGLLELLNIPSLGPKTARLLYEKLGIRNPADLEKAIEEKKLAGILGIGEKTIANIQEGLSIFKKGKEPMPLLEAITKEDNGGSARLIKLEDIKGDLHIHSIWSDGKNSIEELAESCQRKGYSYLAVTDHSQRLKVAGGLTLVDLKRKKLEIEKINKKLKNFCVLFGAEVEIDSKGALDYKDEILKEFDIALAAIHTGFRQTKEQLTKRLIAACKNKYVHIIAHPTARLWGRRPGYELDFNALFKAARETNTCMEINSFPQRLDLDDLNSRYAKETKVKLAINTDAHRTEQLDFMNLGVLVARRAGLEKEDVLNTLEVGALLKAIKK